MKRKLTATLLITFMCYVLFMFTVCAQSANHSTISGGTLHSAAITNDGGLWTWGYNSSGQLGIGTIYGVSVPNKVMDGVVSVSLGEWSTAILKYDGSLWMCGSNQSGQLGNGTTTDALKPVKIMDNVASVCNGGFTTFALKTDGSLWIWGNTLEDDDILRPQKIMDGVLSVSTSGWHTAVIKNDNSLWMWGFNTSSEIGITDDDKIYEPVKIMDNVSSVALGSRHSAVIKTDGSLWIWGDNEYGKLGIGTTKTTPIPVKIMEDVAFVSLGDDHSAAIKRDGSLWICGYNWNGELGNGGKEDSHVPVKIMDDVVSVDLGNNHALAVKSDGTLWTWGANRAGQAGVGHTEYAVRIPTKVLDNVMLPAIKPWEVVYEQPANTLPTSFGSITSQWAISEIEKAYENSLIPESLIGLDLTQKVNRSEFAAIAIQLYEKLSGKVVTESQHCDFTDISGDNNEQFIRKAYGLGFTSGTSKTSYEPLNSITREQLATMLSRVIKKSVDPTWTIENDSDYYMDISGVQKFEDDASISDWAKTSVYYLSKHGIIKGVNNTHFAPKNTTFEEEISGYASATREQAIIITQRILMNFHKFN